MLSMFRRVGVQLPGHEIESSYLNCVLVIMSVRRTLPYSAELATKQTIADVILAGFPQTRILSGDPAGSVK